MNIFQEGSDRLESIWTLVNGVRMHTRVARKLPDQAPAPPIVMVQGLIVSSRYLVPTAERLAPDYRVYALDLPGYGRSEKPNRDLDLSEMADAVVAWLDAVGLGRAVFVSNSFGCQVVVELAVRYPDRVMSAVLSGPTTDPQGRTFRQTIWRALHELPNEQTQQHLMLLDYLIAGPRRSIQALRVMLRDPIEQKLPRVHVPTLVVRGERDTIVPQRWAEEVARLLPQGRLVVIPGAGHPVNYVAPGEFAREIHEFVQAVPGRQPAPRADGLAHPGPVARVGSERSSS